MVDRLPARLLRLEGAAIFAAALVVYLDVGIDRAFGYGLKYPTDFEATHLQRL